MSLPACSEGSSSSVKLTSACVRKSAEMSMIMNLIFNRDRLVKVGSLTPDNLLSLIRGETYDSELKLPDR